MKLVEASGTISNKYQRFYIKIETLHGKNPTEIHRVLIDPCKTLIKYTCIYTGCQESSRS